MYGDANTGTMPSEVGQLNQLQYFYASSNQLDGSIPSQLCDLAQLIYLDVDNNQLSGTIPSEAISILAPLLYTWGRPLGNLG